MPTIWIELLGLIAYTVTFVYVWLNRATIDKTSTILIALVFVDIIIHGFISYLNIDTPEGHNFGLFNIFNMTTWISMIIFLWNLLKYNSATLLLFSIPISAVSILGVILFDGIAPIQLKGNGLNILHILLGILAMGILLLAAIQSILVLYIDRKLRVSPANLSNIFGSLQSIERYLLQLLTSGFIFMTLSLILVSLLPYEVTQAQVLHKVILTLISWFILAILIFGYYLRGWRGVFAAKWTLIGVFLLMLGYFGSKLVIEFIIG
ncbi:MAG: hypothetical protein COA86_13150 [Kangiella sp.]|nr:MAG: hypothetical protein COA86_13150 [Kangiella sp.]